MGDSKGAKEDEQCRLKWFSVQNNLQFNLIEDCLLFYEVVLARHKKRKILTPRECCLLKEDRNFFKEIVV